MPKHPVSVTIEADNLVWLHGQVAATKARGISELLDRLVTTARLGGRVDARSIRSVASTIDIHPDDPALQQADAYIHALYKQSVRRPLVAREMPERNTAPEPSGRATRAVVARTTGKKTAASGPRRG